MEYRTFEGAFIPKPLLSAIKIILAACVIIFLTQWIPIDYPWKMVIRSLASIGFGIGWTMTSLDRVIGLVIFVRSAEHLGEQQAESDQTDHGRQGAMNKDQAISMLVFTGVFGLMGIFWIYVGAQGLK